MREELGGMAVALGMLCFVLGVAYNVDVGLPVLS